MIISDAAFSGLEKIAHKTKMDNWFMLSFYEGNTVVYDLELDGIISLETGLKDFVDGITDPLSFYRLTKKEERAVLNLFNKLHITFNPIREGVENGNIYS